MKRPTIKDLAVASGVSVSTVNRVIAGAPSVRRPTMERVRQAAEDIGFYGLGTIEHAVAGSQDSFRLGALLQQPSRPFYRNLAKTLKDAATTCDEARVDLVVQSLEDLTPDNVAAHIIELGQSCDAIAVVAAEHPLVSSAIDHVLGQGTPVIALIGTISAKGQVGYVGLDHWKLGRMAGWAMHHLCHRPGKIGMLVGNHRYRNQDQNEGGFRSYFRELADDFVVLEPLSTYESSAVGREMAERLFSEHPDMAGLFLCGGGVTGALAAVREKRPGPEFVCVGFDLIESTRAALIDGTMQMVIAHPMKQLGVETISALLRACRAGPNETPPRVVLEFGLYTSINL